MSLLAAQCIIIWLCLQLPLGIWLCLQLPLGMLLGRYIASADVIAK